MGYERLTQWVGRFFMFMFKHVITQLDKKITIPYFTLTQINNVQAHTSQLLTAPRRTKDGPNQFKSSKINFNYSVVNRF
jgi:hypothetical protein